MKVTVFQSKKTQSKLPESPFDNDQFIFETKNAESILEVYDYLTRNFVLNIPLTRNVKTYRRKKDLKDYFIKKMEYLFIDIDHVKTVSDKELILKFFRDNNYKCVIGESRNPLNLKGVLKVDCTPKQAKEIVKEINEYIYKEKDYGDYDMAVTGMGTYQAPTFKHTILHKNMDGITYPTPDVEADYAVIPELNIPENIQDLCKNEFIKRGYQFHETVQDFVKVSHTSEKKSPKGFRWYSNNPFLVIHFNTDRNENIWDDIRKTDQYKEFIRTKSINEIKEILPSCNTTVNKRYLERYPDKVEEFLKEKKILKVQSPMGSGKSKIIEEVIEQAGDHSYRILFITNRVSLADDISRKYKNIKHYLGTELEENNYEIGDHLVCQIDSLWKFSTKYFDLIILDEFSTLVNQLLDLEINAKPHKKNIITKFFSLKKKKIVIADAILFDEQIELFADKDQIVEICNDYRDNTYLEFYKQKDNFIYDLLETAKVEPITFSSGSTIMIKIVEELLKEHNITYKIVSSETPKETRELIYQSFEKKEPNQQVLMYSPTITVGISNLNKIRVHYHYDTGNSVGVLASLQMTKRTRSAEVIKMYLDGRQKFNKTDLTVIKSQLRDYSEVDEDGDVVGVLEVGSKLAQLIRINNILENLHKESFKQLMKYQFKLSKIKINKDYIKPFIAKTSKIVKQKEKNRSLDLFEMYKKMSPEEISEIEMKVYNTSREEELVKMFEYWKNDEYTKDLSEENLEKLLEEDIIHPGIMDSYVKIKTESPTLKKVYSVREFPKSYKVYGYKKERNRWYLNKTLKDVLCIN